MGHIEDRFNRVLDEESEIGRDVLLGEENREILVDIATRTGIPSVDLALGGGLPSGVSEVYGEESSGKTAFAAHVLRTAQADGKLTALGCTEFFDPPYFTNIGVDLDHLVLVKGRLEPMSTVVRSFLSESGRVMVIDSLAALRPIDDSPMAWNEQVFKFLNLVRQSCRMGSSLIVVNQVRFGRMGRMPESAARWVNDMFSTRIELSRKDVQEREYQMVVNIVTNQARCPAVLVEVPVTKGFGIDTYLDMVRLAAVKRVIGRQGSFYKLEDGLVVQGERAAAEALSQPKNSRLLELIWSSIQRS